MRGEHPRLGEGEEGVGAQDDIRSSDDRHLAVPLNDLHGDRIWGCLPACMLYGSGIWGISTYLAVPEIKRHEGGGAGGVHRE